MGLTRFPNGLTVNSTTSLSYNSGAGDGDVDCNRLFANTITLSTATPGVVGQVVQLPVLFASSSAAQVLPVAVPFNGQVIGVFVTIGSVSAVASQYTVQAGSGGTVIVASVTNTLTAAFSNESLAATLTTVSTASGLKVTRAVQGTAGETALSILFQKT